MAGLKGAVLAKGTRGGAAHAVITLNFGDEIALAGQSEVGDFVASMLDKGTPTWSREQIQDRLDQLKTELSVRSQPGRVSLLLQSRREHLPEAIKLVTTLLRQPAFPADALDELKRQTLGAIEQQSKEPEGVADNALARAGNPYPRGDVRHARTFDEWIGDVNAVNVERLRAFHQRFYSAGRATVAVVGDADGQAAQQALQAGLADWAPATPFARIAQPWVSVAPQRLVLATPDKQNATMLVRLAVPLNDSAAEYPALMMANFLLGGGGNSRLWKRIREKEGLSYDVRSSIQWNNFEAHSIWTASAIFAPQNRAKVESAFQEEVEHALRQGFGAAELDEGKRGLLSFRRLSRAQDGSLAANLANNLYLGRTFATSAAVDRSIGALTLEQVNAAMRKYIIPANFVAAIAGDFK
jgi:zinc protease